MVLDDEGTHFATPDARARSVLGPSAAEGMARTQSKIPPSPDGAGNFSTGDRCPG